MPAATRELRFALLGDPPRAKVWYAAIEQSDRHHIAAALASNMTDVPVFDRWEPIAADDAIDAAILFFPDEELFEAAGQLAAHGKGVIIDWECPLPSSLAAELGLLDAEETAAVVPMFDSRALPVLHELRQLALGGRLGDIVLVRMEYDFGIGHTMTPDRLLSDDDVGATLFAHIDTLRWIGGDYSRVTALRTGVTARGFAGQTLNLASENLPDATCVYRVGKNFRWSCEVQGTKASAGAHFDGDGNRLIVDGETVLTEDALLPDPALCLRLIDEAMARKPGSLRWQDRVRVDEIQAAMQRSLRRRRTIDLQFETASERSQFKTQMATVGCFVLVYTFFASVLLLLAGAVFDPRDQLQRQSEAAGFVVPADEFVPSTGQLTPQGQQHLQEIARRWEITRAVVLVESAGDAEIDRTKLETVRRNLQADGIRRVEERTVTRQLAGRGFQRLMAVGRVLAFAPLGVFLVLQILLFVSRPPRDRQT